MIPGYDTQQTGTDREYCHAVAVNKYASQSRSTTPVSQKVNIHVHTPSPACIPYVYEICLTYMYVRITVMATNLTKQTQIWCETKSALSTTPMARLLAGSDATKLCLRVRGALSNVLFSARTLLLCTK